MANISNINDFFVVDSAGLKAAVGADLANGNGSPYVGTDFTVVGRDASSPVANLWLSNFTHKSYILISDNSSNFIIRDSAAGNRLTIDTDGKVGIGTDLPDGNLEVITSAVVSGVSDTVNNVLIGLQSANRPTIILDTADTTYTNRTWNITNVGSAGKLFIGRNGLDVMVMDNNGNVGIGTTLPESLLHIKGETRAYISFQDTTDGYFGFVGDAANMLTSGTVDNLGLRGEAGIQFGVSDVIKMVLDSSGNLGIGTTTAVSAAKLVVSGQTMVLQDSSGSVLRFQKTLGTNVAFVANRSYGFHDGNGLAIATTDSNPLRFATNDIERIRITSSGGISFGSTGAAYGTSGQVLISNGNTSPTWGSATSVSEDNYYKIDDGLNFYLAFKEGSGTTVADVSGGRNNFTAGLGLDWSETGRFGYAQSFNGSNSYLSGTGPSSNITTFSAWVNNDGDGGIQNIVSGTYIMAYVSIYNNNFQVYDGVGWRNGGAVPANEWVHVAFSYDAAGTSGGLQKMYVNGVLGYSATAVGYTGVSSYISKVGIFTGAIRYFNGEITAIKTWDRILGDSEILAIYNQTALNENLTVLGNVGIGTTTPPAKLSVYAGGADGIQLLDLSDANNSGRVFYARTNGGSWCIMNNAANYSIRSGGVPGSTSGTEKIRLTGYSATSWTAGSDETIKENIKSIGNVLDKIDSYRCVEYNLIDDETKDKKIGFIAQDWQEDFPQIVEQMEDEKIGMKYTETIPILLKAIQELKAEIEILKNK